MSTFHELVIAGPDHLCVGFVTGAVAVDGEGDRIEAHGWDTKPLLPTLKEGRWSVS